MHPIQQFTLEHVAADQTRPLDHRLSALQALWDFGIINQENLETYCKRFAFEHTDIVGLLSPDGERLYCAFRTSPLL